LVTPFQNDYKNEEYDLLAPHATIESF